MDVTLDQSEAVGVPVNPTIAQMSETWVSGPVTFDYKMDVGKRVPVPNVPLTLGITLSEGPAVNSTEWYMKPGLRTIQVDINLITVWYILP